MLLHFHSWEEVHFIGQYSVGCVSFSSGIPLSDSIALHLQALIVVSGMESQRNGSQWSLLHEEQCELVLIYSLWLLLDERVIVFLFWWVHNFSASWTDIIHTCSTFFWEGGQNSSILFYLREKWNRLSWLVTGVHFPFWTVSLVRIHTVILLNEGKCTSSRYPVVVTETLSAF